MGLNTYNQFPVVEIPTDFEEQQMVNYPDNPFMNFIVDHYLHTDPDFVNWFYWDQMEWWWEDTPDLETTEFIRHIHYLQFLDGGAYDWQTNPVPLGTSFQEVRDQGLIELDGQDPPILHSVPVPPLSSLIAESDDEDSDVEMS